MLNTPLFVNLKVFLQLSVILLLGSCEKPDLKTSNFENHNDSVYRFFQNKLKNQNFELKQIQDSILAVNNDSLRTNILFDYSYYYYQIDDSIKFRSFNNLTLSNSIKLKDTSKIAESYWDLGNFYYKISESDSAYLYYNKSYKLYNRLQNDYYSGRMLLNMAIVQKQIKDYIGSEVTTIEAIKKLKPLHKNRQLYMAYNNLGILFNELEDYQKSLAYHQIALEYQQFIGSNFEATTLNNIGVAYQNVGDFDKALDNFEAAIKTDSLKFEKPKLYAMLIDNIAYVNLKKNNLLNVQEQMLASLKIRKNIDHKDGIIINYMHLGEYYLNVKDTTKAFSYFEKANKLAEKVNSSNYYLVTLVSMADISQGLKSKEYLKQYITLADSLYSAERKTRNKFTRIKYETDIFKSENKELAEEKKIIIGISLVIFLLGSLIYIIYAQRINFKKLQLEKGQQKANEEIYNLIIASQEKLELGRNQAKKRISEELHDGILSKFFGIRLNLQIFNEKDDENSRKKRNFYIEELITIENEIRNISHEINSEFITGGKNFNDLISDLVKQHGSIGNYSTDFYIDKELNWNKLNNKIKVHFYRICQEALNNIDKYSNATNICITAQSVNKNMLELIIVDDGVGFKVDKIKEGIGIKNMKSRICELHGIFELSSSDFGTRINILIPLEKNEKKLENFNGR